VRLDICEDSKHHRLTLSNWHEKQYVFSQLKTFDLECDDYGSIKNKRERLPTQ
jgi:hypothetical protein